MSTARQSIFLTVVIPCYNEQKNLESGVLDEVYLYMAGQEFAWEIIIVDDGSTDDSHRLVEAFVADKENVSLLEIPHGGKPAAVWAGIQQAAGQLVLFTDMDQSTPIDQLSHLLPWIEEGVDFVIGSRNTERAGTSLIRRVGSFVFLALRRLFLLRDIIDTQCGFKLCRRAVALEIFPCLEFLRQEQAASGWKVTAYDVELLYLVDRAGYQIREVPVRWSNRDQSDTKTQGGGLARYVRESIQMAQEVVRVKRNQLQGFYDGIEATNPQA